MSVVVRATRDFTAYHAPTCQLLSYAKDQEVEGDVAVYLATTGCPVEVVSDDFAQIDAVLAAAAEATAPPAEEPAAPPIDADPAPGLTPAVDGISPVAEDVRHEDRVDADGNLVEPDPAPAPAPATGEAFDPADHNVRDVLAHVEAHPEDLAAVLAAEQVGKQRTTLLDALNDLTAPQA